MVFFIYIWEYYSRKSRDKKKTYHAAHHNTVNKRNIQWKEKIWN